MEQPTIHPTARIAPGAHVIGNAVLGENVSIWYNTVVRADYAGITIGANTNLQDNCTVHISHGAPVVIGENVSVGHGAIIHGCTVGDGTLVGMGAIIMDHAVVGKRCIVAAGALVPGGMVIPDGSLVMGAPARVCRAVTAAEAEKNLRIARDYALEAAEQF